MAKQPLYTFVAGGAWEEGVTFNVKCNCGGDAPLTPQSVKGYGYSKKASAAKVVDQLETQCQACKTTIKVSVLEGDPGYVLTRTSGVDSLLRPQGSTAKPVSKLTADERQQIIAEIKNTINPPE
jgi:hypothetical protein